MRLLGNYGSSSQVVSRKVALTVQQEPVRDLQLQLRRQPTAPSLQRLAVQTNHYQGHQESPQRLAVLFNFDTSCFPEHMVIGAGTFFRFISGVNGLVNFGHRPWWYRGHFCKKSGKKIIRGGQKYGSVKFHINSFGINSGHTLI